MRKLTQRECTLIYMAVLLIVVYTGGFLLCIPAAGGYLEAKHEFRERCAEKEILDMKTGQTEVLKAKCEAQEEEFKNTPEIYKSEFLKTGIEKTVLSCMEQSGLMPVSTFITAGSENMEKNGENLEFKTGSIEVSAEGSKDGALKVLDCFRDSMVLKVASYTMYPKEEEEAVSVFIRLEYVMPGSAKELMELIEKES